MISTVRHNLDESIKIVRERIRKYQERKDSIDETNTKTVLINPILQALGWDIGELDEVRQEYKSKPKDKQKVDYALFIHKSAILFVEAKALGENLDDRKWAQQILHYAFDAGIKWGVLTNGDDYVIYNAQAEGHFDEKKFRSIRISDADMHESALDTLELLSKENMVGNAIDELWKIQSENQKVKSTLENLIKNEDPRLVKIISKELKKCLKPAAIKESLRRLGISFNLPIIHDSSNSRIPKVANSSIKQKSKTPKMLNVVINDLIKAGLIAPPLELERKYKGANLKATILPDGSVMFEGKKYNSLSTAGANARKSVVGSISNLQVNGWTFWKFKDKKSGKMIYIGNLRGLYLGSG